MFLLLLVYFNICNILCLLVPIQLLYRIMDLDPLINLFSALCRALDRMFIVNS